MKNIILTMIAVALLFYTIGIGFSVMAVQVRKNSLEQHVSRIAERALKEGYKSKDREGTTALILKDLHLALGKDAEFHLEILAMDLEKGLLSIGIEEQYKQFNGKERSLRVEKTVLMERRILEEANISVRFVAGGRLYKEYTLVSGENCPLPKLPEGYRGWRRLGGQFEEPVSSIENVREGATYEAVP